MRTQLLKTFILLLLSSSAVFAQKKEKSYFGEPIRDEKQVKESLLKMYKEDLSPYIDHSAEEAYQIMYNRYKSYPNVRLTRSGFNIAREAGFVAEATNDAKLKQWAVDMAEYIADKYLLADGTFLEYDWNTWVPQEEMWRTVPWGVAFHGNSMLNAYEELQDDFTPRQREEWKAKMHKTGEWIYKNPFIGTYVFNSTIDLNCLLWRIGNILGKEEWKSWALKASHTLISRHVDNQGFIHWEDKGVSGHYQLVGAGFLAKFAWESKDPILIRTLDKIFASSIQFSSPTLIWMGNFGTRSNGLEELRSDIIMVEAALNNPQAAYLVKEYGTPDWSDDLELWKAALNKPLKEPKYQAVAEFPGIEGTVVREGDFQAWFFNYPKSLWARGFAGLWMKGNNSIIFSTLHSLPTEVESAKLLLDNTNDWAGFPHVRIRSKKRSFDSQQKMEDLSVIQQNGVQVKWRENLLSSDGMKGGAMKSDYTFKDSILSMSIDLTDLAGAAQLDFHIMKEDKQVYGLWAGSEVDSIRADALPAQGGTFRNRTFSARDTKDFALQVGNRIYAFHFNEIPAGAQIILGQWKPKGLHTRNEGGIRMSVVLPEKLTNTTLRLNFEDISN